MESPLLPSSGHGSDSRVVRRGRLLVAEDDVLLREGLVCLLVNAGFEVVAQTGEGMRLLELVRRHVPDLVIIDIRMPPSYTTERLDAARAIRERCPQVGILLLSAYVDLEHAMDLLAGGDRVGYLLKSRVTARRDLIVCRPPVRTHDDGPGRSRLRRPAVADRRGSARSR